MRGVRAPEVVQSVVGGCELTRRANVAQMAPLVPLMAGLDSGMVF